MSDNYEVNDEIIPTQELLRRKRKEQYEAQKAKRKEERKVEKKEARKKKAKIKAENAQKLWALIDKASSLDK